MAFEDSETDPTDRPLTAKERVLLVKVFPPSVSTHRDAPVGAAV